MKDALYIQLAPFKLKEGVDESRLLEASQAFQERFVSRQPGISKRILLRAKHGGYADLVFFATKEDADRVAAAESSSEACHAFFQIMQRRTRVSPTWAC